MKTRLISLLLCLFMLLPLALTGCSETTREEAEENVSEEASQSAITLTMWLVAEEKPSADVQSRISRLVNSITKSKFKIQLLLNYFTIDEYRSKLDATMTAFEANKQNLEVTEEPEDGDETTAEETETNAQGLSVIKYPEALQNQVDIIYVSGEDMYFDYINSGRLASLKDELDSTAKKIKEYVSPTLLSAAQVNGITYAIPNNNPVGEYTYMLLNKQLLEDYAQDAYVTENMIDGLFSDNLYPFLDLVATRDDVVPINYSYEECLQFLAHYWNVSSEDYSMLESFSAFGHYYESIEDLSRGSVLLGYESLFSNESFVKDYLKLNEFRFKGYIQESAEGKQVAVKFMKGDSTVRNSATYTDADGVEYYPIIVGYPTATSEDIYDNMFGVYAYSRSVSRSMSIVTYLNTNPDFRNLIQYGEEGVDYSVDEKGNLQRLGTGYKMNIWATGNAFIAHPDTEQQLTKNIWENGKKQNQDSLVSPLLGFNFNDYASSSLLMGDELPSAGYDVAVQPGLDKTLLQQNASIATWLQAADSAKGVYVLKSVNVGDSYNTIQYYFYNNDVNGNGAVNVTAVPVVEDRDGRKVQTGIDLVVDYAAGSSVTSGYTLTGVTVRATELVANTFALKVTKGGVEVSAPVKSVAGFVFFDVNHTDAYDIEIYDDLQWVEVRKNMALDTWLRGLYDFEQRTARTHKLEYRDGNTYTFVVYRNVLSSKNDITVDVNATANSVVVNFNMVEDKTVLLGDDDVDYVLCYVTVKAASSDVAVSAKYTFNQKTADFYSTETNVNPKFEKLGTMDTELVKFIERLNTVLVRELNSCTSFEEFKALVADISKLLDSSVTEAKDFAFYSETNYPVLYARVPNLFAELGVRDAEMLVENIQSASSYTIVEKPDVVGAGGQKFAATYEPSGEEYVYFDSPYGIYYNWLKSYKYLPKTN